MIKKVIITLAGVIAATPSYAEESNNKRAAKYKHVQGGNNLAEPPQHEEGITGMSPDFLETKRKKLSKNDFNSDVPPIREGFKSL